MILLCVACSGKDPGEQESYTDEYTISERASEQCFRNLISARVECDLYDCGWRDKDDCVAAKVKVANALNPTLAVEIRVSASRALWTVPQVICNGTLEATSAAVHLASRMNKIFDASLHRFGPAVSVANTVGDPWLGKLTCPAVVVQGLYIHNPDQIEWLVKGGMECYGSIIGEAIQSWLKRGNVLNEGR